MARSHTTAAAVSVWLQGMNTAGRVGARQWEETLHLRLERFYAQLGTGEGTKASESELAWAKHAYYSVNVPYPEYELNVVVFRPDGALDDAAELTPFDTGGMRKGCIKLKAGEVDDAPRRRALIEQYTTQLPNARDVFPRWVNENYVAVGLYERGQTPDRDAHATEVIPGPPNDARAWSWEARVPFDVDLVAGLTPVGLYLSHESWEDYKKWVRQEDPAGAEAHLRMIAPLNPEHDEPLETMQDDLENGRYQ